jgi:ABC-type glycerol-3-phosphate transport system substrate-binding protein
MIRCGMRRTAVPLLALLAALSGCGGGDDDESASAATPGTTPGTSVTGGEHRGDGQQRRGADGQQR